MLSLAIRFASALLDQRWMEAGPSSRAIATLGPGSLASSLSPPATRASKRPRRSPEELPPPAVYDHRKEPGSTMDSYYPYLLPHQQHHQQQQCQQQLKSPPLVPTASPGLQSSSIFNSQQSHGALQQVGLLRAERSSISRVLSLGDTFKTSAGTLAFARFPSLR